MNDKRKIAPLNGAAQFSCWRRLRCLLHEKIQWLYSAENRSSAVGGAAVRPDYAGTVGRLPEFVRYVDCSVMKERFSP